MSVEFEADEGGRGADPDTLEVAHTMRSDATIDLYGGRKRRNGQICHAKNTNPPAPGWLGNPYQMDGESVAERRRVLAAWTNYFLDRIRDDAQFRSAVERLRGRRVGCWCRGVSQDRTPDRWCHLDVVAAWLSGDLSTVYAYLRGEHE